MPDLSAWPQTVSETESIRIRKGLKDYLVQAHVFTDKKIEVQRVARSVVPKLLYEFRVETNSEF